MGKEIQLAQLEKDTEHPEFWSDSTSAQRPAQDFHAQMLAAPPLAWAGFAYVGVFSMFLGFFAWYRGLALGGIAVVGQTQLLQPFLTLFASALLLGEALDPATFVAAGLVILSIAIGRRFGTR